MQMAKTSKRLTLAVVLTILIFKTFAEIFEEDFEEVEHFFGQVASQLGARTALDCSSRYPSKNFNLKPCPSLIMKIICDNQQGLGL